MFEDFCSFVDKYCVTICIILAILALLFIMYGHEHREEVQSALKGEFLKLPSTNFDWWSVTHFVMYGIFGFLIPNYHATFFTIGCAFEVFEDMLSGDKSTQLADCTKRERRSNIMCLFSNNDDYWYAKWDDVFVNLLGYTMGSSVRTTFLK